MFILKISLDPLWAEHSVVDRKLLPRLESDDLVVLNLELDSALHPAKTAMRLHQRARFLFLPPAGRFVLQVRTVSIDELLFCKRRYCHPSAPMPSPDSAPAGAACMAGRYPGNEPAPRELRTGN